MRDTADTISRASQDPRRQQCGHDSINLCFPIRVFLIVRGILVDIRLCKFNFLRPQKQVDCWDIVPIGDRVGIHEPLSLPEDQGAS